MLNQQRRIAVTGGAGFIGSHLIDSLIGEGHHVLCIDEFNDYYDPQIKWANIAAHQDNPRFTLAQSDIRDRNQMRPLAVRKPRAVFDSVRAYNV